MDSFVSDPTTSLTRKTALTRLQRQLETLHWPRLHMTLIVSLTCATGFLASYIFLHLGLTTLWLRYPLAVGSAYLSFLFYLWCWLHIRKDRLRDQLDIPDLGTSRTSSGGSCHPEHPSFEPGGGDFGGGGASGTVDGPLPPTSVIEEGPSASGSSVSDVGGVFEAEEFGLVLVVMIALFGALWATLTIISGAPTLFAELLLDALLGAGLYARLRHLQRGHWLATALRNTAWQFAAVALLLGLMGGILHWYAPEAISIGEVWRAK